jgi:dienelactone hydrolase
MRGSLQCLLALAISAGGGPAGAAPEDAGPLAVAASSVMAPVGGGTQLATDLYVPQTGGPYPTLVLRHGFLRSKQNFVNWGKHLASRGFVAIIPTSRAPAQPNPPVDSDDMLALIAWARAQHQQAGSALQGKVDGARVAVVGHSAGGLASALAASKDSTLRAAVLLDPVDVGGAGATAAPATKVPVAVLLGEPSVCNVQGNYLPIFSSFGGARLGLKVIGAPHCAPEDPSDGLCELACGGASTAEQRTAFRRYATAFLEAYLRCDAAAFPYVGGAAAQADKAIALLPQSQGLALPPAGCAAADGPARDGAVAQPDAVRLDRAPAREASAPRDGPWRPDEALSASPGPGCGCGAAGSVAAPTTGLGVALLLGLLWRRSAGSAVRRAQRRSCSIPSPSSSTSASPRRGPTICKPTGNPSA